MTTPTDRTLAAIPASAPAPTAAEIAWWESVLEMAVDLEDYPTQRAARKMLKALESARQARLAEAEAIHAARLNRISEGGF